MKEKRVIGAVFRTLKGHPFAFSLCVVFLLYLVSRLLFLGRLPVFFDESIFIRWSQIAHHEGFCTVSMTDGYPPLGIWVMIPFLAIIRDPLIGGRVTAVFFGSLTTLGMILLGRELRDWKLGVLCGFLYVLCPFALMYDRLAVTEGRLLTVFVFTVYVAVLAAKKLSLRYIAPLGTMIGLSLLIKQTSQLLLVIAPFAYLAVSHEKEAAESRPLLRWFVILAGSYCLSYGVYSLLRLSAMYGNIALRTATTTKTPSELLRSPFDVFLPNAGTILNVLLVYMTPVLFIAGVVGIVYGMWKRWRPSHLLFMWLLATWVIEAAISKHWMFDTILPRFSLALIPPLLIGAAYLVVAAGNALSGATSGSGGTSRYTLALLLVLALLAMPVYSGVMIVAAPEKAPMPAWDRYQYITDWPSGWGIKEAVAFFESEAKKGKVVIGSVDIRGLPTYGLRMYLRENRNVEIVSFTALEPGTDRTRRDMPPELIRAARTDRTYMVFRVSRKGDWSQRERWPLEKIARYPACGNPDVYLEIDRVIPRGGTG